MEPFDWEQGTRSHLSFEYMIKSNVVRVTKRPVATKKIWAVSLYAALPSRGDLERDTVIGCLLRPP